MIASLELLCPALFTPCDMYRRGGCTEPGRRGGDGPRTWTFVLTVELLLAWVQRTTHLPDQPSV